MSHPLPDKIRPMVAQGMMFREIGARFGMSKDAIEYICRKAGIQSRRADMMAKNIKMGPIVADLLAQGFSRSQCAEKIGATKIQIDNICKSQGIRNPTPQSAAKARNPKVERAVRACPESWFVPPRVAPQAPIEAIPDDPGKGVLFFDVPLGGCMWPTHPDIRTFAPTTRWCGEPAIEGKSYCACHHARATGRG